LPGPGEYSKALRKTGIAFPKQLISTVRSPKQNVLDTLEQRPEWTNKFNIAPGPGAYRGYSDFGYMDFKHKPSVYLRSNEQKLPEKT
jgi:hypothetical protein